uniref:Uncharacterized protein n=1 Tax=Candidatus Kentrum sp. FW TaxID=2126338 RepID=A0A450TCI0_9GAMM|nr:MAG: hypothetical protein BECKFW1821B_GA0114236_10963 [Candidatus Kentron sp. FW]
MMPFTGQAAGSSIDPGTRFAGPQAFGAHPNNPMRNIPAAVCGGVGVRSLPQLRVSDMRCRHATIPFLPAGRVETSQEDEDGAIGLAKDELFTHLFQGLLYQRPLQIQSLAKQLIDNSSCHWNQP